MPLEIVNGYPCKFCSGRDLEVEKDITYYWIETNLILREKITDYKCKNCKVSSYLSLSLLGFYCNFINFSMPISKENSNNPFTIIKFIIKFLGDTKITLI